MDIKGNGLDYIEEQRPIDEKYKKLVEMQCDMALTINKMLIEHEEAEKCLKDIQK